MPKTKIYFASDQHFGIPDDTKSRAREKKFIQWLNHVEKDASEIFLLGDLFDFWFEYKRVVPKGFVRVLGKLALLVDKGIKVRFFVGNHDQWIKDYFTAELGIKTYRKPEDFVRSNMRFHLAHGDGLGPGDHGYKRMKKIFNCAFAKWLFHWFIHPDLGIGLGRYISKSNSPISGQQVEEYLGEQKEWLVQYCKKKQLEAHRDYYIFGHRHLPLEIDIDQKSKYINIGDWITHFSYGEFDGESLKLKFWNENSND